MGTISYQARVINMEAHEKARMKIRFGKGKNTGTSMLKVTLVEQHRGKNSKVDKKYQKPELATDAWVDTESTWHEVTVYGVEAEKLAQQDWFNHGAIVDVVNATYTEGVPFEMRDGTTRLDRPESIFSTDNGGSITQRSYTNKDGETVPFGPDDDHQFAVWDGISEIPVMEFGGSGAKKFEVDPNEGF